MTQCPPFIAPLRLARVPEPFDHPDWIFEIKYDGWRGVAAAGRVAMTRLCGTRGMIDEPIDRGIHRIGVG